MSKFKIGDRVRIVDCPIRSHIGAEGVIEYVNDADSTYTYRADFADIYFDDWFEEKDLELIEPETISETETVEKPKFKIGDRVKVNDFERDVFYDYLVGDEGIVDAFIDGYNAPYRVIFNKYGLVYLREKDLELVESATTSEMETVEKEVISKKETTTKIEEEPEFKVGDIVRVIAEGVYKDNVCKILRIEKYAEQFIYHVNMEGGIGYTFYESSLFLILRDETVEPDAPSSTYTDNIIALMNRQHEKGLKKYGETLEENTTLSTEQRIEHLQEELIDGLQYCEHLKAIQKDNLTANDYQRMAMRTLNGMEYKSENDRLINGVMGLNGEAGEVIDIMKKHLFQGHEFDREHFIEELGDTIAYAALCAESVNSTLEEVMLKNIEKLKKRYPEGFDKARSINRED